METLKKGVAAIRNNTHHVRDVGHRMKDTAKEKFRDHGIMERMHGSGRHYEIGGRTVEEEKQLSEGGFAFVSTGRDVDTGELFALKKITCQDKRSLLMAQREVDILEDLPQHQNIVKYYGHTSGRADGGAQEVVLLFELCPGGHLLDLLTNSNGRLNEAKILSVFTEVCTAVGLLHSRTPPVQHRDLKIENILLGADGKFKLCDFGSWSTDACNPGNMNKQQIAVLTDQIDRYTTMMYRPPEMITPFLHQYPISEQVDIWMLGCILFTLMFNQHPFQDESTLAITNARYDLPSEPVYSDKMQDLTHWMLAKDPRDRPSIKQIIEILHRFSDGDAIVLPDSVVQQKERHRRLYSQCVLNDVDATQAALNARKGRSVKSKDLW
jgi:serine/threonine protein kinase